MTLYGDCGSSARDYTAAHVGIRMAQPPCRRCGTYWRSRRAGRLYLEARWSSLVPYAAAAGLLADICRLRPALMPNSARADAACGRAARGRVGEERICFIYGCPADWAGRPIPDGRIVAVSMAATLQLGGSKTNFGSSSSARYPKISDARYVGPVHGHDTKPKRAAIRRSSRARACRPIRMSPS